MLIEKEWCSFGHKFRDRNGNITAERPLADSDESTTPGFFATMREQFTSSPAIKESAPIFHQFLDCVWQIQVQNPAAFEFSEKYLIELHAASYTGQYGTFLCNSEAEAKDNQIKEATLPVWPSLPIKTDDLNSTFNANHDVILNIPDNAIWWAGLFRRQPADFDAVTMAASPDLDTTSVSAEPTSVRQVLERFSKNVQEAYRPSSIIAPVNPDGVVSSHTSDRQPGNS